MQKDDVIYRQAAIDLITGQPPEPHYPSWYAEQVKGLPSAERKKGRWYKPTGMMPPEYAGRHRCSECDGFAPHYWKTHREILTDFCPNCGADMRGE